MKIQCFVSSSLDRFMQALLDRIVVSVDQLNHVMQGINKELVVSQADRNVSDSQPPRRSCNGTRLTCTTFGMFGQGQSQLLSKPQLMALVEILQVQPQAGYHI